MVFAISSIHNYTPLCDPEYLRILAELRSLGIAPSGNKQIDAAKLAQAKSELISKIKNKEQINSRKDLQVQVIDSVNEINDPKRAEMEEQRLGAMTIAELNRMYFGI